MVSVTDSAGVREVVEGQVWEADGVRWRVVYAGAGGVNLREVETDRFHHLSHTCELTSKYRYVCNPLADEFVLYRISDVLRRADVEDAERLIEAVYNLVSFRRYARAKARVQ